MPRQLSECFSLRNTVASVDAFFLTAATVEWLTERTFMEVGNYSEYSYKKDISYSYSFFLINRCKYLLEVQTANYLIQNK
jgi:hypothetical protein